jgi:hypothetical protein
MAGCMQTHLMQDLPSPLHLQLPTSLPEHHSPSSSIKISKVSGWGKQASQPMSDNNQQKPKSLIPSTFGNLNSTADSAMHINRFFQTTTPLEPIALVGVYTSRVGKPHGNIRYHW